MATLTPRDQLAALLDAVRLVSDAVDTAIDREAPLPDIDSMVSAAGTGSAPRCRPPVRRSAGKTPERSASWTAARTGVASRSVW